MWKNQKNNKTIEEKKKTKQNQQISHWYRWRDDLNLLMEFARKSWLLFKQDHTVWIWKENTLCCFFFFCCFSRFFPYSMTVIHWGSNSLTKTFPNTIRKISEREKKKFYLNRYAATIKMIRTQIDNSLW